MRFIAVTILFMILGAISATPVPNSQLNTPVIRQASSASVTLSNLIHELRHAQNNLEDAQAKVDKLRKLNASGYEIEVAMSQVQAARDQVRWAQANADHLAAQIHSNAGNDENAGNVMGG